MWQIKKPWTSPPEAPPTSTHYYESTSPPEAPPTSTHYYESTSPPEVWDLLVSNTSWYITERLKITIQNILVHRSWLVEWSSHPHPECWIPVNLQATTENSSLSTLLDFIIKKKLFLYLHFSLLSLLPLLACTYLNNAWDLVLGALPLSVCLFKINRFMYSPIVSRFG